MGKPKYVKMSMKRPFPEVTFTIFKEGSQEESIPKDRKGFYVSIRVLAHQSLREPKGFAFMELVRHHDEMLKSGEEIRIVKG